MVHRKVKVKNAYPFTKTTGRWGVHKLAKNPKQREMQTEILDLLYNVRYYKGEQAKDHEVLSLLIKQPKNKFFKFLKDHTRWGATGRWTDQKKFGDEINSVIQVEFLDTESDFIGNRLMELVNKYNKDFVKEDLLYARTEPIEESTLLLWDWRKEGSCVMNNPLYACGKKVK
jgi:hypothetical protein